MSVTDVVSSDLTFPERRQHADINARTEYNRTQRVELRRVRPSSDNRRNRENKG